MAKHISCLLPSAVAVVVYTTFGIRAGGWALAALCYFAILGCMEVFVWSAFGVDPRTIPARMRDIMGNNSCHGSKIAHPAKLNAFPGKSAPASQKRAILPITDLRL